MSAFVAVAVLLTLIAVALIALPLLRRHEGLPPAVTLAVAASLLLASAAALLYPTSSKWNWAQAAASADDPAAMVGRLARRMERNPGDMNGWLTLGRSYSAMEQFPLAARAYQRANQLAGNSNAEALMGLAEALVLGGQSTLDGRAGHLFEQALELDPNSGRALFFAAIAALERNERPLARERFVKLLEADPPPEVRRVIEDQVRALEGPEPQAAQVADSRAAAPNAAVSVPLRITLSQAVAGKVATGAPLFILARAPGQRGAPLAARRLEARFPQDVELRSSDAMIAGTGFVEGQELEIEARIANGGGANAVAGDPFGSVRVKAGAAQRATIEIGQLKP